MSEKCSESSCSSCSKDCSERKEAKPDFSAPLNSYSKVGKVIGIISGKGGVGKSFVTSMAAVYTERRGYRVGVLDADITGPSIPKVFGIEQKAVADGRGMLPVQTSTGIKVMSVNLLLENDTDPVIWRGPIIGNMVKQFWSEVVWEDLDYMFVDMPPGTGDVALTVFQSLPVDGIIIVSSPQELVSMIVSKAVKMANMMNIPILGIVENMSYFLCPDNGKKYEIFGESHIDRIADEYGLKVLAKLPIDPQLSKMSDAGKIEEYETSEIDGLIDAVL